MCVSVSVSESFILVDVYVRCLLSTQLLDILDAVGGSRYCVYNVESAVTAFDSSPAVGQIGREPANVSALVDLEAELRWVVILLTPR